MLSFLGVDEKFWGLDSESSRKSVSQIRDRHFSQAIETLQQLKTKFTPFEKLNVLLETFKEINKTGQAVCGPDYSWSMDELFPVFSFIVVRARMLQLGAEIHMIKDLSQVSWASKLSIEQLLKDLIYRKLLSFVESSTSCSLPYKPVITKYSENPHLCIESQPFPPIVCSYLCSRSKIKYYNCQNDFTCDFVSI